jgi:hypothetical protein
LSFYEGVRVGFGVRDLKIQELEPEGLCTDSTALIAMVPIFDITPDKFNIDTYLYISDKLFTKIL